MSAPATCSLTYCVAQCGVFVAALQVYGNSTRPRTYTILELVGCSSNGNIAQGAALEAMLQVGPVAHLTRRGLQMAPLLFSYRRHCICPSCLI
jgi:hypothetical protein